MNFLNWFYETDDTETPKTVWTATIDYLVGKKFIKNFSLIKTFIKYESSQEPQIYHLVTHIRRKNSNSVGDNCWLYYFSKGVPYTNITVSICRDKTLSDYSQFLIITIYAIILLWFLAYSYGDSRSWIMWSILSSFASERQEILAAYSLQLILVAWGLLFILYKKYIDPIKRKKISNKKFEKYYDVFCNKDSLWSDNDILNRRRQQLLIDWNERHPKKPLEVHYSKDFLIIKRIIKLYGFHRRWLREDEIKKLLIKDKYLIEEFAQSFLS